MISYILVVLMIIAGTPQAIYMGESQTKERCQHRAQLVIDAKPTQLAAIYCLKKETV